MRDILRGLKVNSNHLWPNTVMKEKPSEEKTRRSPSEHAAWSTDSVEHGQRGAQAAWSTDSVEHGQRGARAVWSTGSMEHRQHGAQTAWSTGSVEHGQRGARAVTTDSQL